MIVSHLCCKKKTLIPLLRKLVLLHNVFSAETNSQKEKILVFFLEQGMAQRGRAAVNGHDLSRLNISFHLFVGPLAEIYVPS